MPPPELQAPKNPLKTPSRRLVGWCLGVQENSSAGGGEGNEGSLYLDNCKALLLVN